MEKLIDMVKKGQTTLIPPFPDYVDARVLAATVAETITPPAAASVIALCATDDCWVDPSGTAVVPSTDVTDGTAAFLLPAGVWMYLVLSGQTSCSIISEAAAKVSIMYYA